MSTHANHGYVDCSCRDCFNVAVCSAPAGWNRGHHTPECIEANDNSAREVCICPDRHKWEHHLCSSCADAGCEPESECSAPPEDDE